MDFIQLIIFSCNPDLNAEKIELLRKLLFLIQINLL